MPNKNKKKQVSSGGLRRTLADSPYLGFLRGLELIAIALVKSDFQIERRKYLAGSDSLMEVKWACKPKAIKSAHFDVEINFGVTLRDESSRHAIFSLSANYIAHLHSVKNVSREYAEKFANYEIRLVVWPYFREYVHEVSSRMYVPAIVLPLAIAQTETELKLKRYT